MNTHILDFEKDVTLNVIQSTIKASTQDEEDYRLILCFNGSVDVNILETFVNNNKILFIDLFDFTINEKLITVCEKFEKNNIMCNITVMVKHDNIDDILLKLTPYQEILTNTKRRIVLCIYYYIQNNYNFEDIKNDLLKILNFKTIFSGIGLDNSYCFLYDLYKTTDRDKVIKLYHDLASWYRDIYQQYPLQKINTLHYYLNHEVHLISSHSWQCTIMKCGIYHQHLNHNRINVSNSGNFYPCSYLRNNEYWNIGNINTGLNINSIEKLQSEIHYNCSCQIGSICLPKCPLAVKFNFDNMLFCDIQRAIVDGLQ